MRRRLRTRLALLYGGVFFATGTMLLALVFAAFWSGGYTQVAPVGQEGHAVAPDPAAPRGVDVAAVVLPSLVGLLGTGAVAALLGWVIGGRALRPLRAMTATAQAISADSLHSRIGLDSPYQEFAELGATLDDLFGRLDAAFRSQRDFVANASHELRTPLTVERALLQVALADPDADAGTLRAACAEVLALGAAQERLIDALLTLAGSDQGLDRRQPLDLAGIVAGAVEARRDDAARRGVRIGADLAAASADGDPHLVESLVANLLDNAIRHNVPGGRVDVVTTGTGVALRNTGAVIPPGDVDRLFEPFQRLRRGRAGRPEGHGLGLAIVRAIAAAHGATVTARAPASGGLDVEVVFPAPVVGRTG